MIDIYVYPNTNVLKNKFQETDPEKLVKLETKIVTTRFIDYQKSNHTDFSFKGLKKIHKYLFGDIYDWAGKERTINIAKDNSMFCNVLHISTFAENIFQKLNKEDATKLSREDFCNKISNLYSDLNALHPFREGNGRVQALFIYHFAKQAGYELDLYYNIPYKVDAIRRRVSVNTQYGKETWRITLIILCAVMKPFQWTPFKRYVT